MPSLAEALESADPSVRLQAAMDAGSRPDPSFVPVLVERCAVEPDFGVREMLTWALVRNASDETLQLVIGQLDSDLPQARSQALHTLSKIGDPRA
jgi:HEAT repeat protein